MDETRWLTDDEQRAWRRLGAVMTLLPAALDAQLQRDAELTHFGYWVLAMLSEAPGRAARMSELAALANGSQSRLSHLIAKLEQRGWVRRERASDDGRGSVAVLTEAGYHKVVATAPGHVAQVRALLFDTLTAAQVAQLDEICTAVLTRLDGNGTSCLG
ncbi:DNA-binding transcriptional regulator, MarR family [Micromonospora pattaloongensis]|uniref:DNA-binding transcriptional regulator, MarR family n=1 Tax=Micromonospora pattaloongensis TaxID=405436 RepID=A0A1H3P0H6_9ACTN|nr:MarR family transcriptional regulator [Micromonospora pattaloongensis]SDY94598.1 DNA-binding transcriptional regulator, MarR family [Micromonospora pattaloongensis]